MHRPPTVLIHTANATEVLLVGRTTRALAAAGWPGVDGICDSGDSRAFANRLRNAPSSVLVMRAGAWPASVGSVGDSPLWPPQDAVGLVALGAARSGPAAGAWQRALKVNGGEFSRSSSDHWAAGWRRRPRVPAPLCVWLGRAAARAAADWLEDGCLSWEAAMTRLVAEKNFRVVRWLDLDVEHDPGLRVLEVITTIQRGGAERVTLDLAAELNRQGVACAVATLAAPGRNAYPTPPACFDLSASGNDDPTERATAIHRAATIFGADVIHAHLLKGAEARALKMRGLPLAMTVHNERPGWPGGLEELGPQDVDLLLGCAAAVTRGLPAGVPARTLANGIAAGSFTPTRERAEAAAARRCAWGFGAEDFVLLALANPRPQKRLERLPAILAATRAQLASVNSKRPVRLVLAGSSSMHGADGREAVRALGAEITRWGVAADVRQAGDVEDVPALLAGADVLVSPSAHEGLSLAWLEALAAGRRVVSTAVGGAAEVAARAAPGTFQTLPPDAPAEAWGKTLAALAVATAPASRLVFLPKDYHLATMARRARTLLPRALARAAAGARRRQPRSGIWLVTNNFSCGGAQSSARRLLLALAARQVTVRATVVQEEPTAPTRGRLALTTAGIPIHAAVLDPQDPGRTLTSILLPLDADPPAAVLFWNLLASVRIGLADALLDTAVYDVSPGEMSFDSLESFFAHPPTGLPYTSPRDYGERLTGAVVKYPAEAPRAAALLGCPIHVIPNGVPLPEDFTPLPTVPRPLRLGTAARLSPDKRLEDLLAAVGLAHRELPRGYRLEIAGGPEPGHSAYVRGLRRLTRGLPVHWLGRVEDASGFLGGLSIFTMISRPAGCPNASLEAMAAGLPVVATDWGGASEQIVDGVTGRLVPDGDAPALAAALVELAHDPAARERLGRAGQERVREKFSIARMADAYLHLCG